MSERDIGDSLPAPTVTEPAAVTVLMVGASQQEEFQDAVAELRRRCKLHLAADINAALQWLEEDAEPPALLLLVQSRPGELAADDVERLRREAPLPRVAALLGSWCEGEMRSGSPWPGVIRVYWHQWTRLLPELRALETGCASAWSLPVTSSDEERLLWSSAATPPQRRGLAAIACADYLLSQWLADACRACGLATVQVAPFDPQGVQGAELVLWDVRGGEPQQAAELQALQQAFPASTILALADFPRLNDRQRLLSLGAAAVLAKPVMLADLLWQIEASAERGTRNAERQKGREP